MRHPEQLRHTEHPVEKEIGIVIIKEDFSRLPFEDFFVFLHDNSLQTLLYMISRLFQTTKIQIFSKQFTTSFQILVLFVLLFQTTKIQIFESNSQLLTFPDIVHLCCFKLQRYKFLKAIHNNVKLVRQIKIGVSDSCQYR